MESLPSEQPLRRTPSKSIMDDAPLRGPGEEPPVVPPSPDNIEETNVSTLPGVETFLLDPSRPARNLVVTDMRSPEKNSVAGKQLETMLGRLAARGYSHGQVFAGIDVMNVQIQKSAIYLNANMLLVGSPANYDPENNVIDHHTDWTTSSLTAAIMYSLQWACRDTKTIVAITYAADECERVEWWHERGMITGTHRAFLVCPVEFDQYRPRQGLQDNLDPLGSGETMLALSLPVERIPDIKRTRCGKVDGSATLGTFLLRGPTYTFGAYTGELEVDIVEAAARLCQPDNSESAPSTRRAIEPSRSRSRSRSPYGCLSEQFKTCSL